MSDVVAGLIERLGLRPHPEGGHYVEVYRSTRSVVRDGDERTSLTTIYFLLAAGERSRWHVVDADEAWHFYEGDPIELLSFDPGSRRLTGVVLGSRNHARARAVHVVPAGHWQAARPLGAYGLVGCTVAPGFEFSDFALVRDVPGHEGPFSGPLAPYRDLL